jgi:hypothetical protein
MKTQTAVEWLEDCFNRYEAVLKTDFKKAKQIERDHTTTQIEALRERLVNHFKNFGYSYDVDCIVDKFLKEIND